MSKKKKIEKPQRKRRTKPTAPEKTNGESTGDDVIHDVIALDGLYQNWFLDYASYVILERAVPRIEDGLKPVQRRIMHSLKEMDDGRFNKVANVIGNTMQYHPHGDAAIGEAIVNVGQKELLIETQGNWGDVRTGDGAAAPRYIEARLSKFALEVVYNPQTTEWQLSYDGRKKEPVTLPVKFPLLLAQGVEGIAVGLSTKILPHNFCELIKASIEILNGKNPKIYPDFPTGGLADFTEYNQGHRGGKIKIRAKVDILDKKTLIIKEIPYSTTTTSLIESIVKASEKGKIKVKQVVDNTARDLEIQVSLQAGQSPEIAMDALYAFTDCEISLSPNACVIVEDKPRFMAVNEILKYNTAQTTELLNRELQIRREELMEKILFSSLEKIFIEKRIYRNIEECESWEEVISTIDKGLKPYKKKFYREITTDDIVRLTEIKIKRISRYDSFKADELLKDLEKELKETQYNLKHLVDYAIQYYTGLLEKYGKGRERKTEMKSFQSVTAVEVIANNQKLYVNKTDGFAGWGLKRDEYITECSELDDIIAIRKDGMARVSRIQEKVFMGKDILYAGIWKKGDERMVYNVIYTDGKTGKGFAKRFAIPAVTRDKEYDLTQGHPNSRIHYVSANPNGEAETVTVKLSQSSTARKKVFEYNFAELEIKGRSARGNTITKYPIRKVELHRQGTSTLSKLDLWYDDASGRLNKDKRGRYLGKFDSEDQIIAIMRNGSYKITNYELSNRYEPEKTMLVEKFNPEKVISAIYVDGESKQHMVKRFLVETGTSDKEFNFITEAIGSRLVFVSTSPDASIELLVSKGKGKEKSTEQINLEEFIDVKGWKALGNRLTMFKVVSLKSMEEPPETGPEEDDSGVDGQDGSKGRDAEKISPLKKKEPEKRAKHLESRGQTNLFDEAPKKQEQSPAQKAKPRSNEKARQQNLFEEAEAQYKKVGARPQKREENKKQNKAHKTKRKNKMKPQRLTDGKNKAFGVGDTIEFTL
jgi:topoisomerase IV subunit A